MKRYAEMRKAFYCHDQGCYVVCQAPMQCFSDCSKYHAKRVTGIKERTISVNTGYIEGMHLVVVKEGTAG